MDALAEELQNIDFHHPFTPYDVQLQFMRTVYDVLERGDGQIGILESPTGTVSLASFLVYVAIHHTYNRCPGQIAFSHLRRCHVAEEPQEDAL